MAPPSFLTRFGLVALSVGLVAPAGCAASSDTEGPPSSSTSSTSTGTGGSTSTSTGTGGSTSTSGEAGQGGIGGEGGMGGAGGDDPCAAGCPENTWDIDDNPLTGECGCEYVCEKVSDDDPIDPNYDDDNCDGGDGVVEQCVYVSTSIGNANGTGTRQDPVDTIAGGIALAQNQQVPSVCVSGEIYNVEVTVADGINLYGGFDHADPNFPFLRTQSAVTTVNGNGTVFLAPQIDQETHIAGFTINAQAPDGSGNVYGVRLVGGQGQLVVRYNDITVAAGGNGANGASGSAPNPPVAPAANNGGNGYEEQPGSGQGGPQPNCTEYGGAGGPGGYDAAAGSPGLVGNGGAPGGNGGSAPNECGDGGNGGTGTGGAVGSAGSSGTGGPAIGTVAGGAYVPADGISGTPGTNGKGGGGGGGGGGGKYEFNLPFGPFCVPDKGGGGGSGGCGGVGGQEGIGGGGGGASFGVFAAAGSIVVEDNNILTGNGGDGGHGGDGADGQLGSGGGSGGTGDYQGGNGGLGGTGGDGGIGGPAGGGGGGPSACFARSVAATGTYSGNCTTGLPGTGGQGGTNSAQAQASPGANGSAGPTLQIN